jgi:hypothetical protein
MQRGISGRGRSRLQGASPRRRARFSYIDTSGRVFWSDWRQLVTILFVQSLRVGVLLLALRVVVGHSLGSGGRCRRGRPRGTSCVRASHRRVEEPSTTEHSLVSRGDRCCRNGWSGLAARHASISLALVYSAGLPRDGARHYCGRRPTRD